MRPVDPAVPLRDETGQPMVRKDATGQPIVPRDATGQVLIPTDESGQIFAPFGVGASASLLRPVGATSAFGLLEEDPALRRELPGGVDYLGQVALVEGYNSNVVQTQDVVNGPVTKHPSPFTGIDASVALHTWTAPLDPHEFRLQVRGQHYTPLDGYPQKDDGSINGAWSGQFTLTPRTVLTGRVISTITSVNSARLSDGPVFAVDPTSLQRTYSLTSARVAATRELSERWRLTGGADVDVSATIRDAPVQLPDGTPLYHRGLDYVQPGADVATFYDTDEANIFSVRARYAPTYQAFLLDYSKNPPTASGKALIHQAEGQLGWTHGYSESLRSLLQLGGTVASPPPLDPDRRPILSPTINGEVVYLRPTWLATINANYTYGSANPRLGFGPAASAGFTVEGTPFRGPNLRKLAVVVNGLATRAAFRQGPTSLSRLTFVASGIDLRYALGNALGLMAGYNFRYSTFEGAGAYPPLTRHVLFFGVSGYWSTDRTLPTLQTFVSPVTPPG